MRSVVKSLNIYWHSYGGALSLLSSPYLWFTFGISLAYILSNPYSTKDWREFALSMMPSILGFTLGGFALLIGVGDEKFRSAIRGAGADGSVSPFMVASGALVHFILLQILCIFGAVLDRMFGWQSITIDFFGTWLFLYALFSAAAAVLALLNLANWYDKMPKDEEDEVG